MKFMFVLCFFVIIAASSCKKDGHPIEQPYFGTMKVLSSALTPDVAALFLLNIDGITLDTIKSSENFQKDYKIKAGEHLISVLNDKGTVAYKDTIFIDSESTVDLPAFAIQGEAFLVDDYDPAVIKPAEGKSLIRLITLDPTLPDKINVKVNAFYYDANFEIKTIPLNLQFNEPVSKQSYTQFLELEDPARILESIGESPDNTYFFTYVLEGWDAATGNQVINLDIPNSDYTFLAFGSGALHDWLPNSVFTIGIPVKGDNPPPYSCSVIFQRQL